MTGKPPAHRADRDAVADALTRGLTGAEVAGMFGLGTATVTRIRASLVDREQLIIARDAARATGCSTKWLAEAARHGMLRYERIGCGPHWYYRDEIGALAARLEESER